MRYTLELEWPAVDLLAWALLRSLDDLAARVVVTQHHGDTVGDAAAERYRDDLRVLRTLLDEFAPISRDADPHQACVFWLDAWYVIVDARPVSLVTVDDVRALLVDLDEATRELGEVVASFTSRLAPGLDADVVATKDESATTSSDSSSLSSTTSTFPEGQRDHRLAPGCEPARPDVGDGAKDASC